MEKYTNSNTKRATRIRHRRTNIMKLYTTEGETLLLLLLTATGNVLIDCDDKTLVILLEELRPLRLVSNRSVIAIAEDVLDGSGTTKLLDEELLELLMHSRLSSRYQTGSANPIYASKTTEKLMYN